MGVLKDNNILIPAWGSEQKFITGLDPLGLQNTSEATYSSLLPGFTNLTNRIRYYGFYCWLLEEYAKEIKDTDPIHQNTFIRRAELMLAIIMQTIAPEITQVTGSSFASDWVHTNEDDNYDLALGADKEGDKKVYWKFSSGAFGQYYAGALQDITLVNKNQYDNFVTTSDELKLEVSGRALGVAYGLNINAAAKQIFLNNIKQGKLFKKDIETLYQSFSLQGIIKESQEWRLYQKLLIGKDKPLYEELEESDILLNRNHTLSLLFELLGNTEDTFAPAKEFPVSIYKNKELGGEFYSQTANSWYFYQLNEYWHYGAGAIFWAIMVDLENKGGYMPLNKHITDAVATCNAQIGQRLSSAFTDLESLLSEIEESEEELVAEIIENIKLKNPAIVLSAAFLLILKIYQANSKYSDELYVLSMSRGYLRDGHVLDFFDFIKKYLSSDLNEFTEIFFYRKIIFRHQLVAYRKTGNGDSTTLKFLLEENYLQHLENFAPQFTSPRLRALLNILEDMGWVDEQHKLTPSAKLFSQELTADGN